MPTVREALERVWNDENLKERLLSNPRSVLEGFGLQIPDHVSVRIHEDSPTLINAVLPSKPEQSVNLSNADPVTRIVEKAWRNPAFKARLLANPKEVAAEDGLRLPESVDLKIWENTATVEHMVLPMNPGESELSDLDLEAVAGGTTTKTTQTIASPGTLTGQFSSITVKPVGTPGSTPNVGTSMAGLSAFKV